MTLSHKQLFRANRALIDHLQPIEPALLAFEQRWIDRLVVRTQTPEQPATLVQWRRMFDALMAQDTAEESPSARYVAQSMTREQFKCLVQAFALDGLTEAQVFYHLMPRLSLEAQMPMLRMLLDEFGCGNLKRSHTTLYKALLSELGMPTDLESHIEATNEAGCAFANLFCWLAMRADDPSWFAGMITYFETLVPTAFGCYTALCERLEIQAHHYYSEHVHIDVFHAKEGQRLLKAMANGGELDCAKAWHGVCVGRAVIDQAFEQAVRQARAGSAHPEVADAR
ncbi:MULTISPECIES: iron-containing redox enzyme family protein [unclassified Pseudomonas]|uniref:iron-containing redox enzyme family protein n=1 Tax=unclassified Pseudomonas TaxID=196821 RepID=UPI000BCCD53C|nr:MULTISPECIES: iron-containing redox enzyme family protein [unclassified Pseudomonas]PVZ19781.1 heme oxygenase-like protein [Pseudomonas sp. URIL14HWK12:I12]PVZ26847.1 heme oxygenase-like protein [Pseudomonas sp. URIL14HWK12:I10]PVZ37736.1 heme oxygenase-like protein [Pseudomonas sp. URIL14HWK12:I11]SNZ05873.1 Iron-containing redox enzyme [Pseudomonas sp. URIL14HWK12:I9]